MPLLVKRPRFSPGYLAHLSAQLLEAASTGRSDASDRHVKRGGRIDITWPARSHQDPQQLLATSWQLAEGAPHLLGSVRLHGRLLGVEYRQLRRYLVGRDQVGQRCVLHQRRPAATANNPDRLAPDYNSKPRTNLFGVLQAAEMLGEPQPGRLVDVARIGRAETETAGHCPDETAELLDQYPPCRLVALRRGSDQAGRLTL